MIGNISNIEDFKPYLKKVAYNNVDKKFKDFAHDHFGECTVVYDDFSNSMRLLYKGYLIPRSYPKKDSTAEAEELTFQRVISEGSDEE